MLYSSAWSPFGKRRRRWFQVVCSRCRGFNSSRVGSSIRRWPVASPTMKYTRPLIISTHEKKRCQRWLAVRSRELGGRQKAGDETRRDPWMRADPEPSRRRTVGEGIRAHLEYCAAGLVSRISEIQRREGLEYLQSAYEQQGHGQRIHPVRQPCNEAVAHNNSPQRSARCHCRSI